MKAGVSFKGNMKTYHFLPNKYGRELLLDIGRIEKIPNFNLGTEPHQLSFYDILFIDKGTGHFMLDDNEITLEPGTIIFTSPGHSRQWHIEEMLFKLRRQALGLGQQTSRRMINGSRRRTCTAT